MSNGHTTTSYITQVERVTSDTTCQDTLQFKIAVNSMVVPYMAKTIQIIRGSIQPMMLVDMHICNCLVTTPDLFLISSEEGSCHKKKNTFLHNCPS
jgi:hypothetical protein